MLQKDFEAFYIFAFGRFWFSERLDIKNGYANFKVLMDRLNVYMALLNNGFSMA